MNDKTTKKTPHFSYMFTFQILTSPQLKKTVLIDKITLICINCFSRIHVCAHVFTATSPSEEEMCLII